MTDGEFKSIMLPCYQQMYATAFSILRNKEDASDAVQDCISMLWIKHEHLNPPENPHGFCCRSVRNICIDRLREDSKRYFDSIDNLYDVATDERTDAAASFHTSSARIARILARFKDKQRKVLILSIFSQLSSEEISGVTGHSPENVRKILSRGRQQIKEYFSNDR